MCELCRQCAKAFGEIRLSGIAVNPSWNGRLFGASFANSVAVVRILFTKQAMGFAARCKGAPSSKGELWITVSVKSLNRSWFLCSPENMVVIAFHVGSDVAPVEVRDCVCSALPSHIDQGRWVMFHG